MQFTALVCAALIAVAAASSCSSDGTCSQKPMSTARVQFPAPDFNAKAVKDGNFVDISLDDFKGQYAVLFFYPYDFTFVCPTEIISFSDRISEFEALETRVAAISTDSHHTHLAWTKKDRKSGGLGDISYPLISDMTKEISRKYGVLIEDEGVALRGLFILNEQGILRHISINDLPVGRNVDEILRLIKAFKHTDKHGEVCPAGWQPGQDTIIPDPTKSLEYFSKN